MLPIRELVWNRRNIVHIARHRVIPEEVEEVCYANPFVTRAKFKRLRIIGQTETGRYLTIILEPKERGVYYPITARSATVRERERYRRWKRKK